MLYGRLSQRATFLRNKSRKTQSLPNSFILLGKFIKALRWLPSNFLHNIVHSFLHSLGSASLEVGIELRKVIRHADFNEARGAILRTQFDVLDFAAEGVAEFLADLRG
jgi:hypothetical protein